MPGPPPRGELNRLVHRAIALTEKLNGTPYADKESIREIWAELTGKEVDERFNLISSGHPVDPATHRSEITTAPVRIERGVWIGTAATVLQGVTVGADAVVAAGAVVTKDVPPATVVAGVPARVVKTLVPEETAG